MAEQGHEARCPLGLPCLSSRRNHVHEEQWLEAGPNCSRCGAVCQCALIRATRNDTIGEAIAAVAPFEAEVLRIAATLARNVGLQDSDSDEVSAAMTRRAIELKAALDRHRAALTALRTPTEDAESLAVADSAGA